jgi:hypothetical protein
MDIVAIVIGGLITFGLIWQDMHAFKYASKAEGKFILFYICSILPDCCSAAAILQIDKILTVSPTKSFRSS